MVLSLLLCGLEIVFVPCMVLSLLLCGLEIVFCALYGFIIVAVWSGNSFLCLEWFHHCIVAVWSSPDNIEADRQNAALNASHLNLCLSLTTGLHRKYLPNFWKLLKMAPKSPKKGNKTIKQKTKHNSLPVSDSWRHPWERRRSRSRHPPDPHKASSLALWEHPVEQFCFQRWWIEAKYKQIRFWNTFDLSPQEARTLLDPWMVKYLWMF